jgi:signal transduction histidine kinase
LLVALTTVRRHAAAAMFAGAHRVDRSGLGLVVRPAGRGPPDGPSERLEGAGHMGLAGMRERISALGGSVRFAGARGSGASLEVLVPVAAGAGP